MQALPYSGFWLTPGTLYEDEMTAAYAIEDFPRTADMVAGIDWIRPNSESDIIERGYDMVESLSNRLFVLGRTNLKWHWQGLTPGMTAYLLETVLGGAPSARVSLRTFDRAFNRWGLYNAVAQVRMFKDAGEAGMGGFTRLEMIFTGLAPIRQRIAVEGFSGGGGFGEPTVTPSFELDSIIPPDESLQFDGIVVS